MAQRNRKSKLIYFDLKLYSEAKPSRAGGSGAAAVRILSAS